MISTWVCEHERWYRHEYVYEFWHEYVYGSWHEYVYRYCHECVHRYELNIAYDMDIAMDMNWIKYMKWTLTWTCMRCIRDIDMHDLH